MNSLATIDTVTTALLAEFSALFHVDYLNPLAGEGFTHSVDQEDLMKYLDRVEGFQS